MAWASHFVIGGIVHAVSLTVLAALMIGLTIEYDIEGKETTVHLPMNPTKELRLVRERFDSYIEIAGISRGVLKITSITPFTPSDEWCSQSSLDKLKKKTFRL